VTGLLSSLRFLLRHPLNRRRSGAALARWLSWQLGSRLLPGPVVLPFVNDVRLIVQSGMTGATGNVDCGLHEVEDMALVLHALRPDDLFVDIGANVGSYTMLGAATGARCLSIEPIPSTFAWLMRNVGINGLGDRVHALNLGLGRGEGRLRFTDGRDTVNHVLAEGESAADAVEVPVRALDAVVDGRSPTLVKLDVEGFESEVLAGAGRALADPSLLAVIMELNGSGVRYGFDDNALHRKMLALGVTACRYERFERNLAPLIDAPNRSGNTLYVRDLDVVRERVDTARRFRLGTGVEL